MWRNFKSGGTTKADSPRGLPASWYRSEAMYQLETRAIFSKRWMLLTHCSRFKKTGDYLSFTIANFCFFLIQDRDGTINSFHNVCRHRAFPVIESPSGTTPILSCKYHRWSYGLKKNLAKVPRFETVPDFDKAQHSLFPMHVLIDKAGLVYRHRDATDEEFENINAFYRQILDEDKELCVGTQENVNAGVFTNGELHPSKEMGPISFKSSVRQMVMEHRKNEERQGGWEIWPATLKAQLAKNAAEDEIFCSHLEASSCVAKPELA